MHKEHQNLHGLTIAFVHGAAAGRYFTMQKENTEECKTLTNLKPKNTQYFSHFLALIFLRMLLSFSLNSSLHFFGFRMLHFIKEESLTFNAVLFGAGLSIRRRLIGTAWREIYCSNASACHLIRSQCKKANFVINVVLQREKEINTFG